MALCANISFNKAWGGWEEFHINFVMSFSVFAAILQAWIQQCLGTSSCLGCNRIFTLQHFIRNIVISWPLFNMKNKVIFTVCLKSRTVPDDISIVLLQLRLKSTFFEYLFLFQGYMCFFCMCVHHAHVPWELVVIRQVGARNCSNPGPLPEQPVLFTTQSPLQCLNPTSDINIFNSFLYNYSKMHILESVKIYSSPQLYVPQHLCCLFSSK